MRRGATAYQTAEADEELGALADAARAAADGAAASIEDLTARVIRLEAQLELLTAAAMVKKLGGR